MIFYLVISTLCMGLLLLFYHLVLEKERMHHINRGYLLFSLVFALIIPIVPVGIADQVPVWVQDYVTSKQQISQEQSATGHTYLPQESITNLDTLLVTEPASSLPFPAIMLSIYIIVSLMLAARLFRIIHMIQLKANRNPRRLYQQCELVFLNENLVPHTFMNTIFVNRKAYESGSIGREVLIHEQTHARQKHTLDLLFVEVLKVIFWFNPVLHFYKKAMVLNHEFLADEAVVRSGATVPEYQTLLLQTLLSRPAYSLSHSFSFPLTKKRLLMMTRPISRIRIALKSVLLIPLFTALAFLFGCESTTPGFQPADDEIHIAFTDSELIIVNNETMSMADFEEMLNSLPDDRKVRFFLEDHPEMLTGPVMNVNSLIHSHQRNGGNEPNKILTIEIDKSENIKLSGRPINIDELKTYLLDEAANNNLIINLRVSRDADFGLITDVQRALRSSGILQINYSTIKNQTDQNNLQKQLDEAVTRLNESAHNYLEMSEENYSQAELEEAYKQLVEFHDNVTRGQIELYRDSLMTPPTPPFPPSPEARFNDAQNSASGESALLTPTSKSNILEGDIYMLRVLMNHQGMLLIDENPARIESVRTLVKQFVDKNVEETAIVSIKTDRQTSYNDYIAVLEEIKSAYRELREEASRNKFGISYSLLTNSQQAEIEELYSEKIHIERRPESEPGE